MSAVDGDGGLSRAAVLAAVDRSPDVGYAVRQVAAAWLQLLAVLALYHVWPGGLPAAVLYVALVGLTQYRLYFPLHDACHGSLFPKRWMNESVGRVNAGLLLSTFPDFTRVHLSHHRLWGTPEDPGAVDYHVRFRSRLETLRFFLGPLLGSVVLGKLWSRIVEPFQRGRAAREGDRSASAWDVACVLGAQCLVFLALGADPLAYLAFWALPGATVFLCLARLRMYLEHGPADYRVADYLGEHPRRIARTHGPAGASPLFAYMNFRYHQEHHLFPALPSARLPEVHGFVREYLDPDDWSPSYARTLARVSRVWRTLAAPAAAVPPSGDLAGRAPS